MITSLHTFKMIQESIDNLSDDILIFKKDTIEPIDPKVYYIDSVIDILTDQEEIKKYEAYTDKIQSTSLTYNGTKDGDTIYIVCMLKSRNKSTAYPLGEIGVLRCKVLQSYYSLAILNQLKTSDRVIGA